MTNNIFNFHKIDRNEICIGDIYIVDGSYNYILAKKDAIIIRLENNKFLDIDSIKNENDCIKINYYLNKNIYDNLILSNKIDDLYIGKLILKNIRFYKEINKDTNDIFELKLIKKD